MSGNSLSSAEKSGSQTNGGKKTPGASGSKKTLLALLIVLVGGGGAAAAFMFTTRDKPVPTVTQDNAEKLKAAMQKAETEAKSKAPPPEVSSEPELPATRGVREPK